VALGGAVCWTFGPDPLPSAPSSGYVKDQVIFNWFDEVLGGGVLDVTQLKVHTERARVLA
jgi:hypothetical protein